MKNITQEYNVEDFKSQNFHKILLILFYEDEQYLKRLENLFSIIPLDDQKFVIGLCKDQSIARNQNINEIPSILITSYPNLIKDEIFNEEPILLIEKLNKLSQEFDDQFTIQKNNYFTKIDSLLKENPIFMFIVGTPEKPMCRFTSKLIQQLQPFNIQFGFYDIEIDKLMVGYLKLYSNWQTFPQIFINNKLIGGADATIELINQKKFQELIPKDALMTKTSKLEQIQLLSSFLILIDGQPDPNCEIAKILTTNKIQYQFYNIKRDQEVRTEVFNSISGYIETSHDLEPLLLHKNTIYNEITLKKELQTIIQ